MQNGINLETKIAQLKLGRLKLNNCESWGGSNCTIGTWDLGGQNCKIVKLGGSKLHLNQIFNYQIAKPLVFL
jgi:hypothetical protein